MKFFTTCLLLFLSIQSLLAQNNNSTANKQCTGINEVYSECGNNGCINTCENPTFSWVCRGICNPGCICKENYLRNSLNVCVEPKDCGSKKICKRENEIYKTCGPACVETCQNKDGPAFICSAQCVEGCFCAEGYIRDENTNNCVLLEQCPPRKCTGLYEMWSDCGNDSCQKNCQTFGLSNLACRPACNPGCICQWGYIKNEEGKCVDPQNCHTDICPEPNTEYTTCVPCDNTCEVYKSGGTCNFLLCNKGCTCKKGYYRNNEGKCVLPEECDKDTEVKCGEYEYYLPCNNPCPPEDCSAVGALFKCAVVDPNNCKPACRCIEGRYRLNGKCVAAEECKNQCSDPNEIYKSCGTACPKTCRNKDNFPTVCTKNCVIGCFCKDGYVRDEESGKCIKPEECPQGCNGDPNAISLPCGNPCPITCANKDLGEIRFCPEICLINGCTCKTGYVLDETTKKCIKPTDCPKPICGPNAKFSKCDNHPCVNTCEQPDLITRCTYEIGCYPGCVCVDGYLKNAKGECVPKDQCPGIQCGENEIFDSCPGYCTFDLNCERLLDGILPDCAAPPPDPPCYPQCRCIEGFVRIGEKCLPKNACCNDINAELVDCPRPCDVTCTRTPRPGCQKSCNFSDCACKRGFVLNEITGKCVTRRRCLLGILPLPEA